MGSKVKIYIAGPMTGKKEYNFPKFKRITGYLRRIGHDAVSPAEITDEMGGQELFLLSEEHSKKVIEEQLKQLKTCDYIYLMNGWEKSVGARNELKVAIENDIKILLEQNFSRV